MPAKFGISFNKVSLNQAGALVHVYTDGSVRLNHGGTEMGQGLFTKVAQVVSECFNIPINYVHISGTSTDEVPIPQQLLHLLDQILTEWLHGKLLV